MLKIRKNLTKPIRAYYPDIELQFIYINRLNVCNLDLRIRYSSRPFCVFISSINIRAVAVVPLIAGKHLGVLNKIVIIIYIYDVLFTFINFKHKTLQHN